MIDQRKLRHSLFAGIVMLVIAVMTAACGGSSGNQAATTTPRAASGTVTPGSGGSPTTASKSGTPASSSTSDATTPEAGATSSPNVGVSPSEVTMGNAVFTFTIQPAQPMLDPVRMQATPTGGGDQNQNTAGPSGTYVILGGSALKVTNNLDPSQSAAADQPQEMLRHVSVQVKDKAAGQLIPSLVITMDLLREGRPILQDQPLVPMVPSGGGVAEMAYGNNVKFPGAGEYQVFVRTEPSPLLGAGGAGVAQFNVSLQSGQ